MRVDETIASGGGGDDGRNGGGPAEIAAAWTRVKRRLRAELGEDVFASWFARLELEKRQRRDRPAHRADPLFSRAGSSRTISIAS